eukprot:scaffold57841_cov27-Tisochrysis_lutea.AAC.1
MPLFPLGAAYLPHTTPVLNIFEPRYRAMYNDILFNGARRFMVTNVDPESGALAEVGVVFYLDELKEVSEQTQDRVKYIGQHRVIDRVRLKKVLNPEVISTGETYLKAEVEVLHDSDMPGKIEDTEADKSEAGERSEPSGDDEDARADQPTESDEVLALQKEAEDLFIALVRACSHATSSRLRWRSRPTRMRAQARISSPRRPTAESSARASERLVGGAPQHGRE